MTHGEAYIEIPCYFGPSDCIGFVPSVRTDKCRTGKVCYRTGKSEFRQAGMFEFQRGNFVEVVWEDGSRSILWDEWLRPFDPDIQISRDALIQFNRTAQKECPTCHDVIVLGEVIAAIPEQDSYSLLDLLAPFDYTDGKNHLHAYTMYNTFERIRKKKL